MSQDFSSMMGQVLRLGKGRIAPVGAELSEHRVSVVAKTQLVFPIPGRLPGELRRTEGRSTASLTEFVEFSLDSGARISPVRIV